MFSTTMGTSTGKLKQTRLLPLHSSLWNLEFGYQKDTMTVFAFVTRKA